jgi:hypothetical protein
MCELWISLLTWVNQRPPWGSLGEVYRGCFPFESRISTVIRPQNKNSEI